MKFTDDLLLINVPHERRVLQMALYAMHLASGKGIYCKRLKSSTIEKHLRDIAKFLLRFSDRDARFANPGDSAMAPEISGIISEVKRIEEIPNKCDPWGLDCQEHLRKLAAESHEDGHLQALANWSMCGLHGGFRLSEWAQNHQGKQLGAHASKDMGKGKAKVPLAFCLKDLTFLDARGAKLKIRFARRNKGKVKQIRLKWTHQKNGNHGEEKLFTRHKSSTDRCFINNMMEIVERFHRLCLRAYGQVYDNIPLSLYLDEEDGQVYNITDNLITRIFRRVACQIYKLDPATDKIKFSSHSLRVGACVILHAQGFTGPQIKFLLRWKSDTFMRYLRDRKSVV